MSTESLLALSPEQMDTLDTSITMSVADAQHPLAGIDEDIEADLAALGITLTPDIERELEQERRLAMAATLFRRVQRVQKELAETQRAMDLELDMVRAHYERQMAPQRLVVTRLLSFIQTLAELTPWGKKKSHATPYGTFGVKDYAPTVQLVDETKLLEWARAERPELVRASIAMPLAEALAYFTETELDRSGSVVVEWSKLKASLDPEQPLPPGVALVKARRESYVKLAAS